MSLLESPARVVTEMASPWKRTWGRRVVGGVAVANPLWLAPLAEVSNFPVREMFRRLGAGLTHTEMISLSGLVHGNRTTVRMLPEGGEAPLVLQFFGCGAEDVRRGAAVALARGALPQALQLNMACPVRKVVRRGEGARLLETPDIARAMVKALGEFGLPVWVKIRLCAEEYPLSTEKFVEMLFEAGASHVSVHGRTQKQLYAGSADRDAVERIARAFPEKISGSGDVYRVEDVLEYLRRGCVGVLIARGGMRDPFLVPRSLAALGYSVEPALCLPSPADRVGLLMELGLRMEEREGERGALSLMKRFLSGMFKGTRGAAHLRTTISTLRTVEDVAAVLHAWQETVEGSDDYGGKGTEEHTDA
jgi:tRNA-dihydrouridine synthase